MEPTKISYNNLRLLIGSLFFITYQTFGPTGLMDRKGKGFGKLVSLRKGFGKLVSLRK